MLLARIARRALTALWFLLLALSLARSAEAKVPGVYWATLTGVINPLSAEYLTRAIREAEDNEASALVVTLDTPGGLDSAMRTMVQSILASRVPVIVYVAPPGARAASAGLFVTMAAHVAAMAPGTNIGAAHPVFLGGDEGENVAMDKATADASAYIRSLAEARGRNAEWAERAVRESVSAAATEAVALEVIDLIASDGSELMRLVDGRRVTTQRGEVTLRTVEAPLVPVPMNLIEQFLHAITDPNIAFVLLSLGAAGLLAELWHPGTVIPGALGAISLVLGWVALGSLPTNWGGAALLLLAFVLLFLEVQTGGTIALGVAGVASFVLGASFLFRPLGPVSPAAPAIGLNPLVVGVTGLAIAAFVLVVVRALLRLRRRPPLTGPEALVGAVGVATADVNPQGVVRLGSEDWTAIAEGEPISEGEEARVVRVEGVTLVVEPVPAPEPTHGPGSAVTS